MSTYAEAAVDIELIQPQGGRLSLFDALNASKANFDPRGVIYAFTSASGPGVYRLTIRAEKLPWPKPDPPGELPGA